MCFDGKEVRVKKAQKIVGIMLVAIVASVSAASPAYADGEDAANGAVCTAASIFYPSYYSANCR
jgi:hypothetical protein